MLPDAPRDLVEPPATESPRRPWVWGGTALMLGLALAQGVAWSAGAASPPVAVAARTLEGTSGAERRLLQGVRDMVDGRTPTPAYLGGLHPDWKDDDDHCGSIYFRVALRQGLLTEAEAEAIAARLPVGDPEGWRAIMFPEGYREVPLQISPERIMASVGDIPAGHLVSFDGSDHVMMSTGRRTPQGEHEVYSFKGGGVETPVWGDSVGYDPAARVHVTTLEAELEALRQNEQPLEGVRVVEGRSVLGMLPAR